MVKYRGDLCHDCPYQKQTQGFAVSRGEQKHGVMIVLEALGEQETFQGIPAVGPTGGLLNRMIERTLDPATGKLFRKEDFLVTNTVWCRPVELIGGRAMNRAPNELEVDWCMDRHLLPLIKKHQPRAILAAGGVPLHALTGRLEPMGKLRGYNLPMVGTNIPVVGTYHPAYLMKGKLSLVRVWQMDFLKSVYIARHGEPAAQTDRTYIEDPLVPAWELLVGEMLKEIDKGAPLSFDIETPHAGAMKDELIDPEDIRFEDDASFVIFRISFSTRPGWAVSVPWTPGHLPGIRALLATAGIKIVWNRFFDVPRVEYNGCPVGGTVWDGMDMWHFTEPGFPMGLKYATTFVDPGMPPWHLSKDSRPAWYNAADSDTALRCVNWCRDRLERERRWHIFERHFVTLGQRLQKISLRGIPTSAEKRAEKRAKYEKMFEQAITWVQPYVDDALKPVSTPYKKTEAWLRKNGKWVEGRMVPVPIVRAETREDIPPAERCDQKKCIGRWVKELDGKRRCEKHLLKKMKESVE